MGKETTVTAKVEDKTEKISAAEKNAEKRKGVKKRRKEKKKESVSY